MQDRYAGDVGDFLKLGLLRWLVAPRPAESALQLGIVWYLAADESHNADGKHIAYLDPTHRSAAPLRALDADLYDRLSAIVRASTRSVVQLERSGALPRGTRTHAHPLDFAALSPRDAALRLEHRSLWLSGALHATTASDLVFIDPDNGLRTAAHRVRRHRTKSVKHAYLDELEPFAARGQSIVAYHHADRSGRVEEQARRRLTELAEELGEEPLGAVVASRGTTRLFLIVPAAGHAHRLTGRVRALEASPWSVELKVLWWAQLRDRQAGPDPAARPDP